MVSFRDRAPSLRWYHYLLALALALPIDPGMSIGTIAGKVFAAFLFVYAFVALWRAGKAGVGKLKANTDA